VGVVAAFPGGAGVMRKAWRRGQTTRKKTIFQVLVVISKDPSAIRGFQQVGFTLGGCGPGEAGSRDVSITTTYSSYQHHLSTTTTKNN